MPDPFGNGPRRPWPALGVAPTGLFALPSRLPGSARAPGPLWPASPAPPAYGPRALQILPQAVAMPGAVPTPDADAPIAGGWTRGPNDPGPEAAEILAILGDGGVDYDIARRIEENSFVDPALPPGERQRVSDEKRKGLISALYDQQLRGKLREDAEAFSFPTTDAAGNPIVPAVSEEDARRFENLRAKTGYRVEFPPEHGGYGGRLIGRDGRTPIATLPRAVLRRIADDPGAYAERLSEVEARRRASESAAAGAGTPASPAGAASPGSMSRPGEASGAEGSLGNMLSAGFAEATDAADRLLTEFSDPQTLKEIVLDSAPLIGNYRSAVRAWEGYEQAYRDLQNSDMGAFFLHGGLALIDTYGAASGLPFMAKLGRRVALSLIERNETLGKIYAHAQLNAAKSRAAKELPAVPASKVFGKAYDGLTPSQKETLDKIYSNIKGRVGEQQIHHRLERAGYDVKFGPQGPRAATVTVEGVTKKRILDRRVENIQSNVYNRISKVFREDSKTALVEVKVDSSDFKKMQKFDKVIPSQNKNIDEISWMRLSTKQIPEKMFVDETRRLLTMHIKGRSRKFTQQEVDALVDNFVQLRHRHDKWFKVDIWAGTVARLVASRLEQDEGE